MSTPTLQPAPVRCPGSQIAETGSDTLTGQNAREQCNIVSSQADNMAAAMGGLAKVTANLMSFGLADIFSTKAQAKTNIRNILHIDMSDCEIDELAQSCANVATANQTNTISFRCPYCDTHGCDVHDISQTNTDKVKQTCVLQSLLDILSRKKATQDVSVAMELVQRALGGASATSNTDVCNKFSVDQSSRSYVQTQQSCIQKAYGDQINEFIGCGNARQIVQSNYRDTVQSCMLGSTTSRDTSTDSGQSGSTSFKLDQSATGVAAAGSCCVCCIIMLALFFFFFNAD